MRTPSLALATLVLVSHALAGTCACDVTARHRKAADAMLSLNAKERARSERLHLPFGMPEPIDGADNERALHQDEYIIWYDADLRIPLWTAYRLDWFDIDHDRKRTNCFRTDPRLDEDDAAQCNDYSSSGFERGHLAPSDSIGRTETAMVNTFILSNMTPQIGAFNRGVWKHLETRAREWAEDLGPVWIISGSVLDQNDDGRRDDDDDARFTHDDDDSRIGVAIPTHFYKIMVRQQPDGTYTSIAFLLEHSGEDVGDSGDEYDEFLRANTLVSIDHIESLTGIDFFDELPLNVENGFESLPAPDLWPD